MINANTDFSFLTNVRNADMSSVFGNNINPAAQARQARAEASFYETVPNPLFDLQSVSNMELAENRFNNARFLGRDFNRMQVTPILPTRINQLKALTNEQKEARRVKALATFNSYVNPSPGPTGSSVGDISSNVITGIVNGLRRWDPNGNFKYNSRSGYFVSTMTSEKTGKPILVSKRFAKAWKASVTDPAIKSAATPLINAMVAWNNIIKTGNSMKRFINADYNTGDVFMRRFYKAEQRKAFIKPYLPIKTSEELAAIKNKMLDGVAKIVDRMKDLDEYNRVTYGQGSKFGTVNLNDNPALARRILKSAGGNVISQFKPLLGYASDNGFLSGALGPTNATTQSVNRFNTKLLSARPRPSIVGGPGMIIEAPR